MGFHRAKEDIQQSCPPVIVLLGLRLGDEVVDLLIGIQPFRGNPACFAPKPTRVERSARNDLVDQGRRISISSMLPVEPLNIASDPSDLRDALLVPWLRL